MTHQTKNINYDQISESEFNDFLDSLKGADRQAYNEESQDGFADLYNCWNDIVYELYGWRRFNNKILINRERAK